MADGAKKLIDFSDYLGGEETLANATRNLRKLKTDVTALSKTVADDSGRIKAGFDNINAAIAGIQNKALKLNLFSGEDKAILAALASQLGELKKRQEDYKATVASQALIQRGLSDTTKQYTSELAKQKDALRAAALAQDVEGQKKAAAAIRATTQETKELSAALRGANSGLTAAKGSYNELVIQNNKLLASLQALDGGLSGNNVEAKKLQEQIFANTQVLKEFDAATNRNFREVGNYAKGFSGLVAELAKARAAQAGLTQGSEEYNRAQIRITGFQTAAQKSAAQMGLSFEQAEAKIQGVTAAVQPLTTALVRLEKEQEGVAASAGGKETEAFRVLGFQIERTKKEIDDVAAATASVDVANVGLQQQLGFTREAFEQYLLQLAVGAVGLQAIVQGVQAVFQANVEYSRNLAEVRKTTGLTADEAERLAQSLKELDSPTNLAGLLKIASVGGQLGIAKGDLLEFTKAIDIAVQALGNDFSGGAEEIATTLGKISTVFGKQLGPDIAQNILAIGSAVNELGAVGAATAPFLTDVALRTGAASAQFNIGLKDALAYAAVLQETGFSAEVSGTALNRLYSTLATRTKESFEIAKKANPALTLKEFTNLVNTDFNAAIQLFLKGLNAGNASTTEVSKRLATLKLQSGEAKNAIVTLAANTDLYAQRQATANEQLREATSLSKEAAVNIETLGGSVDQLGNEAKEVVTSGFFANILKGIVDIARLDIKLIGAPFREIGNGLTYIRQRLGLVDKPLTDYTANIVSNTMAARKQLAAQQELVKGYVSLEATTGRSAAQELELSKTRAELLKQFGTTDAAAIQAGIDQRKKAAESNVQFFKNDIAQYDELIAKTQARAAAAQNALNSAPRTESGTPASLAGQKAAEALLIAERDLAEQQRQRGQAVAALAKLEGLNTAAKKDGADAADEEAKAEEQLDRTAQQRAKNRVGALRDELADNAERLKQLRDYQAQQGKLFDDKQIAPEVLAERVRGSEDLAIQIQRDGAAIRIKIARAEAAERLEEAENDRIRQSKKKNISEAELADIQGQYAARRVDIFRQEKREIAKARDELQKGLATEPLEFKVATVDFDLLRANLLGFVKTYEYEAEAIRNAGLARSSGLDAQLAARQITERKYQKEQLKSQQTTDDQLVALDKKYHKSTLESQAAANRTALTRQRANAEERKRVVEEIGAYTQEAEGAFFAIKGNFIQADIERTQQAYDNELAAAGENSALKLQVQQKYEKQLKKLNYDKAKAERDQAAISVAISTAVGIAKAFAEYAFPYALIPAGIAAAQGLLQEAVIFSKPLPAYFKGRKGGPAELAITGERGPELIERVGQRAASGGSQWDYVAKPTVVALAQGDNVYSASVTTEMLANAGLNHAQAQQPMQVAQAFQGAAQGAAMAREEAASRGFGALEKGQQDIAAALRKLKTTTVNVHRGSDADVETSNTVTRHLTQRTFGRL